MSREGVAGVGEDEGVAGWSEALLVDATGSEQAPEDYLVCLAAIGVAELRRSRPGVFTLPACDSELFGSEVDSRQRSSSRSFHSSSRGCRNSGKLKRDTLEITVSSK